jgi:hypothetical protein
LNPLIRPSLTERISIDQLTNQSISAHFVFDPLFLQPSIGLPIHHLSVMDGRMQHFDCDPTFERNSFPLIRAQIREDDIFFPQSHSKHEYDRR